MYKIKPMSEYIKTLSFELAVYAKGDRSAKRVVLVLPGRLDTKDYIHMTSLVNALAEQGYYAVSFDPPGSWESGGDTKEYSTTNYIKAVNELIEYFGNKPTVLAGHSRGGTVSILVGATNQNVKAIIPIMATYGAASAPTENDIKAGEHRTTRDLPPGGSRTGKQVEFTLPLSYFDDAKRYKPAEEPKGIKIPKLVIYGRSDSFTSPERVKEVFASASEPKELLGLDCDHNYRYYPKMIEKVNNAVVAFLQKYMPE